MSEHDGRDALLKSVERLRLRAGRIEDDLIELHNPLRFDHRTPGVVERARRIETEITDMSTALHEIREHVERERDQA